jgi:K+-sensing histidine kinase KdpD
LVLKFIDVTEMHLKNNVFKQKLIQSTCHALRTPLNCAVNMSNLMDKSDDIPPFMKD